MPRAAHAFAFAAAYCFTLERKKPPRRQGRKDFWGETAKTLRTPRTLTIFGESSRNVWRLMYVYFMGRLKKWLWVMRNQNPKNLGVLGVLAVSFVLCVLGALAVSFVLRHSRS